MKRSPMRRARKNRRRIKQPDERAAYREAWPHDEWDLILGFEPPIDVLASDMRRFMAPELNHLWTNPRRHLVPCIITLSKINHDWFHENIDIGRMLCMLVKLRKGEADLALWRKCYGKNVETVLDEPRCLDERYAAFRAECLERLTKLAGVT